MSTAEFHPSIPRFWWAKRRSYLLFMVRELSCLAVAWSVVYLAVGVWAIGSSNFPEFLDTVAHPLVLVLNVIALVFLLWHAITWFALAPRALVIHLLGRRVPSSAVLAGHYATWLVVSAVIAWLVLA